VLIKQQTFDRHYGTGVAVSEARSPRWSFLEQYASGLAPFSAIILQFGLIVLAVHSWQIESLSLARLMQFALVGFVIHHLLPLRFRLPFFAILSLVAIVTALGQMGPKTWVAGLTGRISLSNFLYHLTPGLTLIGIGLTLIGLCHIPIRFSARVALVVVAGAALTLLRAHSQWFADVGEMWVILGSMFIFRLMVYLYDLKHRTAPFTMARAISYFFMLPNPSFPLFPIVDYKTFCSTYYNEDWVRVYQTGLRWMIRGVFQLLLYRLVYQFAPLDITKLSSTLDVAGFMVGSYLLYLRISGSFHLIVGLLHMFGFNLPETHHLYLLASSFTDLWRRINIYWKDFVMRLFFYPAYFKLRKIGTLRAMSVATLATFFATWLLHSWQWFWIRGSPLFSWLDVFFWAILGILVLLNGLYEATLGQRRTLTTSRVSVQARLIVGLQTIGTFAVICTLWTVWSCQSWGELRTLADAASRPKPRELAIILAGLAAIGASGALWGRSGRDTSEGLAGHAVRGPFNFWPSAAGVGITAICLLAAPSVITWAIPSAKHVVARLHYDVLNARDMSLQRRGYYEQLDVGRVKSTRRESAPRATAWRWRKADKMPEGWQDGANVICRKRSDFLMSEIVPSVSTVLRGAIATTNHLGMRDREYEKTKPRNTYRAVLLGSSHDLGSGVKDEETYENIVEDRLNHQLPDPRYSRYEILNLSTSGDCVLQMLLRLEQFGFQYEPDAAILSVSAVERQFLVQHLRKSLTLGIDPPSDYRNVLERIAHKAGVHGRMPDMMIERRLLPYVSEIYEWVFDRFARQCEQRRVRPVVIYRPAPVDFEGLEQLGRSGIIRRVSFAKLEIIDLSPAFDMIANRDTLIIAQWDHHTSPTGHRLLADKLYEGLVPLLRAASPTVSSPDR
jgi:hypothetical protein